MNGAATGRDAFVRPTPRGTRDRGRSWLAPAIAGVLLVAVGLLTLESPDSGTPFDPDSTGPSGLRALVDTLQALQVEVVVTDDVDVAATADSVLVPPLGWDVAAVRRLAEQGPRVVAQVPPSADSVPSALGVGGLGLVDLEPDCPLLADVRSLRASQWIGWQPDAGDEIRQRCLVREPAAWLHLVDVGAGELMSLSTMAPLVNERFTDSDAALAGVRLLAPTGTETVVVLTEPPGTPPPTLFDLVDRRWFDAAWLTLGVLLALALAKGRRLGRPVDEQLPVRVPAGELARALGDLRHRAGHDARSAQQLRDRTLRYCRRQLGMPPSADADAVLAELRTTGLATSPGVAAALTGPLPDDPDGLVAVARALAELRATMRRRTTSPQEQP